MSSNHPLSISAFPIVTYLCNNPTVILGGSLGLAFNGGIANKPDPYMRVNDIDLIFRTRDDAEQYIVKMILSIPGGSISFYGDKPYTHWIANVFNVSVCIFVNPEATSLATRINGILVQPADQIMETRARIYNNTEKYKKDETHGNKCQVQGLGL